MTPTPPLIELQGVQKIYGEGEARVTALAGVDIVIERGEFVMVMGASGSGKSTCMNILGGLDTPCIGAYRFAGIDIGTLGRDQLALLRRRFVGFVFQSYNLLPRTTARENVELPLVYQRVGASERARRAMGALQEVGLANRSDHTPAQLSGGQQQRVAIARALVTEPAVLFADEPTGNLDSERSRGILELLGQLNRERRITIVMVTHEPELAEFASRLLIFRDGCVVADGPPREVL